MLKSSANRQKKTYRKNRSYVVSDLDPKDITHFGLQDFLL